MRSLGRSRTGDGAVGARRRWGSRLTAAVVIPVVAACMLVVVMPWHAGLKPSLAAARSAPDLGLTKATALRVKSGRTNTVTLASKSSRRWLFVYDPYDPQYPCPSRCVLRAGAVASALVGVTVQSRRGECVARAILEGPAFDNDLGNPVDRQFAQGLIASRTTFTAAGVATVTGRVYLELNPDSRFRCSDARYAVTITVQRARGINPVGTSASAGAAEYLRSNTTLAQKQLRCQQIGVALDRKTKSLTDKILADQRRHGLAGTIAKLRAEINTANQRYLATPCPPR